MERERWLEVCRAVDEVAAAGWVESKDFEHPTVSVVLVYLYACLWDRPVSWACDRRNWGDAAFRRPPTWPSQPTVSRRTRANGRYGSDDFWRFLAAVGDRLSRPTSPPPLVAVRRLDGKPLEVAAHSTDRDATFGRAAGRKGRGYKLHAAWSSDDLGPRPMPDQWCVAPLNACERLVARRLVKRLGGGGGGGGGYLLADGYYDDSRLYDLAADAANHQLLCPRQRPGAGLGHHYQSPRRLRAIGTLEASPGVGNDFGPGLYRQRKQVERDFGNLTGFGGGLQSTLPPWVRRPWRARNWVHGKLLINAARIRCLRRRRKKEKPRA